MNIEEIFLKLFMVAHLPTEMSPSMHRKVQPNYVGSGSPRGSLRRSLSLRRRLSDACGAIGMHLALQSYIDCYTTFHCYDHLAFVHGQSFSKSECDRYSAKCETPKHQNRLATLAH